MLSLKISLKQVNCSQGNQSSPFLPRLTTGFGDGGVLPSDPSKGLPRLATANSSITCSLDSDNTRILAPRVAILYRSLASRAMPTCFHLHLWRCQTSALCALCKAQGVKIGYARTSQSHRFAQQTAEINHTRLEKH